MIAMFLAWLSAWSAIQAFVLFYSAEFVFTWAWKDALLTNVLIGASAYITINGLRYYAPSQTLRLIYSVVLAGLTIYVSQLLATQFVSEDVQYVQFFEKTFFVRCIYAWFMISFISTITWLWSVINDQQETEARRIANENLARESELATLRQQLQPHFLFNSLNSISALAGSKPELARKMIQQLSDFLRGTLKRDGQHLIILNEEMEHLHLYLEIEKIRFGHRLKTQVDIEPSAATLKLPALLLQPIVENAIKFGLYDTIGETVISINATATEGFLNITVKNPYDPQTAAAKQGTGFGLSAVQRRLYLLYARHDLVITSQKENTFTTTMKIPQVL